ncbi:AsnC family protein [Alloacidobacterium dinghuense]|uniref:AsnC family protein n=1 Tax=Alloacidobacterium dinghuense TaxID=2763107 RepID=A0A7G8BPM9_9BACT|nr:AsnC family protein [Alloacidobacterium dinghuense]QNI34499.1 AsnC family protein [Alloacidobacterium dinghuense]
MKTPPLGTMCIDCGCCRADLYAVDDPICWACDAGEPCKNKQQSQSAPAHAAVAQLEENVIRTTDDIKQKIIAADPSISNVELGRRLGVKDGTVFYIRKQHGIRSTAKPGTRAKKTAAVTASSSTTMTVDGTPAATQTQPQTISVSLTPERMDLVWGYFSPEEKAIGIKAILQAQLEAC